MILKNNKTLPLYLLLSALINTAAVAEALSDRDAAARLAGSWYGTFSWTSDTNPRSWLRASSEDRYSADGTLDGTTHYTYPDRQSRTDYKARWAVKDGYLVVTITEADGGFLRAGTVSRDKILSLSDSTLVLQAADDSRITLRRHAE